MLETPRSGPRLIIVCGLPGSGKTTHPRLLAERLRAVRFCPDLLRWMEAFQEPTAEEMALFDSSFTPGESSVRWRRATVAPP